MDVYIFSGLLAGAACALCLLAIRLILRRNPHFPYTRQEALFTPAERAFLSVLEQIIEPQFLIFGKVRLADLVKTRAGLERNAQRRAFYKIIGKHVDFVICRARDLTVVGVIELDDSSHLAPDRQARDRFVDGVLNAAGIPIAHIKVQRRYAQAELRAALAQRLGI